MLGGGERGERAQRKEGGRRGRILNVYSVRLCSLEVELSFEQAGRDNTGGMNQADRFENEGKKSKGTDRAFLSLPSLPRLAPPPADITAKAATRRLSAASISSYESSADRSSGSGGLELEVGDFDEAAVAKED